MPMVCEVHLFVETNSTSGTRIGPLCAPVIKAMSWLKSTRVRSEPPTGAASPHSNACNSDAWPAEGGSVLQQTCAAYRPSELRFALSRSAQLAPPAPSHPGQPRTPLLSHVVTVALAPRPGASPQSGGTLTGPPPRSPTATANGLPQGPQRRRLPRHGRASGRAGVRAGVWATRGATASRGLRSTPLSGRLPPAASLTPCSGATRAHERGERQQAAGPGPQGTGGGTRGKVQARALSQGTTTAPPLPNLPEFMPNGQSPAARSAASFRCQVTRPSESAHPPRAKGPYL